MRNGALRVSGPKMGIWTLLRFINRFYWKITCLFGLSLIIYTPRIQKMAILRCLRKGANEIAGNPVYDGFLRADGIKIILDLP